MNIATSARCREMDRLAEAEFCLTTEILMENAGAAVAEFIASRFSPQSRILFLCGKGNNGGDGLVAARKLVEMWGLVGEELNRLMVLVPEPPTEGTMCDWQLHKAGDVGLHIDMFDAKDLVLPNLDLIVDALLGTGMAGTARDPVLSLIEKVNESHVPVLAVDIPSGLDSDTGEEKPVAVRANWTVTFGLPKHGFFVRDGVNACGELIVCDIGFPDELLSPPLDAQLVSTLQLRARPKNSNKGMNGSVLIVAGSRRYRGAAVLAAKGAVRAGAGLVTVASVECVCDAVASTLPEATLLPISQWDDEAVERLLNANADAVIFGPGLGLDEEVGSFLKSLWGRWTLPCVIDADALTWVSRKVPPPKAAVVMTPHPGEMGRLLGISTVDVQDRRWDAVRQASDWFKSVVLLKGAHSVVAAEGRPLQVCGCGNPGMATGGMGDVLSGVIGTLLAQGLSPFESAKVGMVWHAQAGDWCHDAIGSVGYTASELADGLVPVRDQAMSDQTNYNPREL